MIMKELTILSGKGGTGKTSISAALATVAKSVVFCDNDVDAADLHLIFQPKKLEEHNFTNGSKAIINSDQCSNCGVCMDHCRFDAIHLDDNCQYFINSFQCEGCRLCERICPDHAITSEPEEHNSWYVSSSRFGYLVHAQMAPGEENSGKLVSEIRRKAIEIAKKEHADFIINDGPPGIGCPVISSLSGTNAVLLVIEPSMSAFHDVQRLVQLVKTFKIRVYAVINKYDINEQVVSEIERFLNNEEIPLLGKIPFDQAFVEAMIEGKSIVEYQKKSLITEQINNIWNTLQQEDYDKIA